jgi:protein prenyltransferase alpha subunit repeat containing protein 1
VLYRSYIGAINALCTAKSHDAMLECTAVIILANPAHQTALNARKKLVLKGALGEAKELRMIAAMLTVPECAKQGGVWYHRQWLLRRLTGADAQEREGKGNEENLMDTELPLIFQSCEIYPRNYYAWAHLLFCLRHIPYHRIKLKARLMKWIEMHVSDASAVHYLVLVDHLPSGRESEGKNLGRGKSDCESQSDTQSTYDHALALVRTYPTHQALWMYLRAAYCASSPSGERPMPEVVTSAGEAGWAEKARFLTWVKLQVRSFVPGSINLMLTNSIARRMQAPFRMIFLFERLCEAI